MKNKNQSQEDFLERMANYKPIPRGTLKYIPDTQNQSPEGRKNRQRMRESRSPLDAQNNNESEDIKSVTESPSTKSASGSAPSGDDKILKEHRRFFTQRCLWTSGRDFEASKEFLLKAIQLTRQADDRKFEGWKKRLKKRIRRNYEFSNRTKVRMEAYKEMKRKKVCKEKGILKIRTRFFRKEGEKDIFYILNGKEHSIFFSPNKEREYEAIFTYDEMLKMLEEFNKAISEKDKQFLKFVKRLKEEIHDIKSNFGGLL